MKTNNAISRHSLFENCERLTSLDLSSFSTYNTHDMSYMFNNCHSLQSLNINFITSDVKNMQYMFGSCFKLTSLDIRSFDTSNVKNFTNMFINDENLDLYLNLNKCSNLKKYIPHYINTHDISN